MQLYKPNFAYNSVGTQPMSVTNTMPLATHSMMPKRPPLMSHLKSAATGVNNGAGSNPGLAKSSGIGVVLGKPMVDSESRFGHFLGRQNRGIS